jgi:hypothetical protein
MFLCTASLGSAQTATPGGPWIYAYGWQECPGGTYERDKGEKSLWRGVLNWVQGSLSAAAYYGEPLRKTDPYEVAAGLDRYCDQHPNDPLYKAAVSLVDELSKTK